ncbi:MAG: DUF3737 family protein [Bacilli bacterium]
MTKYQNIISNISSDQERIFFKSNKISFTNIYTGGPLDGESAFKFSKDIEVNDSYFALRYPFWNCLGVEVNRSNFAITCRGPFWYSNNIVIKDTSFNGDKVLRECQNIDFSNGVLLGDESIIKCQHIKLININIESIYAFLHCQDINATNLNLKGKYSFQYSKDINLNVGRLETKDPFWHSENIMVKDMEIIGEYVAWYAKNVTFVRCKIKSKQPFCYSENIKFIDCELVDCDYLGEESDLKGNVITSNCSIYNPKDISSLAIKGTYKIIKE